MGPGGGPPPPGIGGPGGPFGGLCHFLNSCFNVICCCWLFQDCFRPPGPAPGPPGPPGPGGFGPPRP
ncbi:hypothetical protein MLD38_023702 [Melastoma candidum]|uniref:Uncharacterized protein n=1 Tax=Melastoma candidum TaxID=119954 RepID=A0ACB9NSX1_9MYRT|nr:hypothetical protein MLD38_023702 [Melastoma candidum]